MSGQAKKLLYVFECGPYSTAAGLEALDAALIGASFEQTVSLLFLHDGVFQLKRGQNTQDSRLKQYTKTFRALEDFDITDVYAHDLSLLARGLRQEDLIIDTKTVGLAEIKALIATQDKVFTF